MGDNRYDVGLGVELDREVDRGGVVDGVGYDMTLVLIDGQYALRRMQLSSAVSEGKPVTGELLRELPVGHLVTEAARDPLAEAQLAEQGRRRVSDAPTSVNDPVLSAVAAAYRYGFAVSDVPTRWVMDLLDVNRSKANRWVGMAREAGLLGETAKRHAGGTDEPPLAAARARRENLQAELLRGEELLRMLLDEAESLEAKLAMGLGLPPLGLAESDRQVKAARERAEAQRRQVADLRVRLSEAETQIAQLEDEGQG